MRFVPDVWTVLLIARCSARWQQCDRWNYAWWMEKISILFKTGCCGRLLFIWYVIWPKIYEKCCNEGIVRQFNSNISSFMRCYYRISIYLYITHITFLGRVAKLVQRLATGLTVWESNLGGGEIFPTCPDRPWGPPSLLYNGYRVFPGGKERPGRDADPSSPSSVVVKKE